MKSCKVDDLFDETQHPLGHPKFVDLFRLNLMLIYSLSTFILFYLTPLLSFLPPCLPSSSSYLAHLSLFSPPSSFYIQVHVYMISIWARLSTSRTTVNKATPPICRMHTFNLSWQPRQDLKLVYLHVNNVANCLVTSLKMESSQLKKSPCFSFPPPSFFLSSSLSSLFFLPFS